MRAKLLLVAHRWIQSNLSVQVPTLKFLPLGIGQALGLGRSFVTDGSLTKKIPLIGYRARTDKTMMVKANKRKRLSTRLPVGMVLAVVIILGSLYYYGSQQGSSQKSGLAGIQNSSLKIPRGSSANLTVTLTSLTSFSGNVGLSASASATGVAMTFYSCEGSRCETLSTVKVQGLQTVQPGQAVSLMTSPPWHSRVETGDSLRLGLSELSESTGLPGEHSG